MKCWYALFTKPRRERQVGEVLSEKGIEAYVPTIRVRQRRRIVEKPFFPRYMFARVDFTQIGLSDVQWTPGLTQIVSFDNGPPPIPEAMIDHLKQRLGQLNSQGIFTPFRAGDRVRIVRGPLQDFDAVFEEHLSATDRVRILVEFLQNVRRVEIDVNDIRRLD